MKQYFGLGLAALAGAALGAAAVSGLHAQTKPPAYVVVESDVTNQDGFLKEFAPKAQKALGEGASKPLPAAPRSSYRRHTERVSVVISSYALCAALAAHNSPAYKAARTIGDKYGKFRIYAVEGLAQ